MSPGRWGGHNGSSAGAVVLALLVLIGVHVPTHSFATLMEGSLSTPPSSGIFATFWPQTLSWDINSLGGGLWQYQYTWTATGSGSQYRPLDYIVIEVPGGSLSTDFVFGSPTTYSVLGPQNFSPISSIAAYGIKFDANNPYQFTFTFASTLSPTWGDFFAKDGGFNFAINTGFFSADGAAGHIAVPGIATAPEPGTLLLLGSSLLATGVLGRRLRKRV